MATTPFLSVEIRCPRLPRRTMAITTTPTPSTKSNSNNNNANTLLVQQPRLRTIFCQVKPIGVTAIYLPVFPLIVIVLSCVCVVMYFACESYHRVLCFSCVVFWIISLCFVALCCARSSLLSVIYPSVLPSWDSSNTLNAIEAEFIHHQ